MAVTLGVAFVALVAVTACAPGFDAQNASAIKPTADRPCGNIDQVCAVEPRWQDDTCCGPDDACPGPHAGDAPPGFCEDAADFDPSPQYGRRHPIVCDGGLCTQDLVGEMRDPDAAPRPRTMHKIRKAVP